MIYWFFIKIVYSVPDIINKKIKYVLINCRHKINDLIVLVCLFDGVYFLIHFYFLYFIINTCISVSKLY